MLFWYPLGRKQVMANFQTLQDRPGDVERDVPLSVDPAARDDISGVGGFPGETGARRPNVANDPGDVTDRKSGEEPRLHSQTPISQQ